MDPASPAAVLDWLHPALDRCRQLIADASARSWTKVSHDGATELVTETDLAVEAVLVETIRRRMPAAILSEESFPDESALDRGGACFVIDPIDGTTQLAASRPGYAVSVALFVDGTPAAAALDLPAHDRRFTCVVGKGAFLNGARVVMSEVDRLGDAVLAVSATQRGLADLDDFWRNLGARALKPTPAFAAKTAAVLAGDCDAALYLPTSAHTTAVWDYAAAATLVREAGGWYGSLDGADLLAERPYTYTGGWVVTPPRLRDELLATAAGLPPTRSHASDGPGTGESTR